MPTKRSLSFKKTAYAACTIVISIYIVNFRLMFDLFHESSNEKILHLQEANAPTHKKKEDIFNPFRDIQLTLNKKHTSTDSKGTTNDAEIVMYSSHHCVYAKDDSPELDSTRFVTRTCRYTNLYYSPRDQKFHYYPSPSERDLLVTKEDLMTLERGLEVSLGNVFRKHSKKRELVPAESIWRP